MYGGAVDVGEGSCAGAELPALLPRLAVEETVTHGPDVDAIRRARIDGEGNFLDLTLMLLSPIKFGPLKRLTIETCLGNCTDLQVICSGMLARAFQRVGYPIFPHEGPPRHFSQTLPRDFDLSPNFEIIKFNATGDGAYKRRAGTARPP